MGTRGLTFPEINVDPKDKINGSAMHDTFPAGLDKFK
jgi:hypothetical protein